MTDFWVILAIVAFSVAYGFGHCAAMVGVEMCLSVY